jgi:hypothetical protein
MLEPAIKHQVLPLAVLWAGLASLFSVGSIFVTIWCEIGHDTKHGLTGIYVSYLFFSSFQYPLRILEL